MDRYLKLINISTAGPGGSKFTVITATLCMDIEPTVLELQAAGLMTTENIFQSPIHGKISCCLMPCSTLEHAHVAGHKIRVATLSWKYLARLGEIHIH